MEVLMFLSRISVVAIVACVALHAGEARDLLKNQDLSDIYNKNIKKTTDEILKELNTNPSLYQLTTKNDAVILWEATLPRLNKFIARQSVIDSDIKNFFSQKFNEIFMHERSLVNQLGSYLLSVEDNIKKFKKKTQEELSIFQKLKGKIGKKEEKYGTQVQKDAAYNQLKTEYQRLQSLKQKVEAIKAEASALKIKTTANSIEKQLLITLEFYLVSMITIIRAISIKINAIF